VGNIFLVFDEFALKINSIISFLQINRQLFDGGF
jgi:hypothetical protein